MSRKEQGNIQVYRKKWNFNIGIIIFGIILVYLIVTVLTYITAKHVSAYEVREGSIYRDNSYTGLVLRQEMVVQADSDGYINYFVPEGSKVGKKTNVYSLSPEKLKLTSGGQDEDAAADGEMTSEEQDMVLQQIQSFSESFQASRFEDVYTFKDSVENILSSKSSQSRQSQLNALVQSGTEGVTAYTAADDGIIVYSLDGYEGLTMDQVTSSMLTKEDYKKTELANNTKVKAGDSIYKLVTDETWMVVIELDDDMAKELADTTSVEIKFSKDSQTAWGSLTIYNTEDGNLGFITFDQSMVRYVGERYLDLQLILEDETGLKIPKSAVVNKEFYTIPQEYLTQGGDSNESGFLVKTDENTTKFTAASPYYRDNKSGLVYVDTDDLKEGDTLIKPESNETCTVHDKGSLKGVYNINKGYAEFKQVQILSENAEYYIVASGNSYGLANYDHIALDGSEIHEHEIVF